MSSFRVRGGAKAGPSGMRPGHTGPGEAYMRRAALVVTALIGSIFGFSPAHGQPFGNSLDPSAQAAAGNLQQALENNKTNQASEWVNPDTRASGTATPVRTFRTADGTNCREFVETIIIGGRHEQGYGTACRQPDGSWRIVGNPAAEPPARTTTQRIERYYIVRQPAYPPAYYYPQPWGY